MDKSEVNRHKRYEHIVPVSPFEENKEGIIYENINVKRKETGNRNQSEELQRSTTTTSTNVNTTYEGGNNKNNYNKSINATEKKSRGFRSFRL